MKTPVSATLLFGYEFGAYFGDIKPREVSLSTKAITVEFTHALECAGDLITFKFKCDSGAIHVFKAAMIACHDKVATFSLEHASEEMKKSLEDMFHLTSVLNETISHFTKKGRHFGSTRYH
ncbi:MAG: hypothetical protein K0U21_04820 [Proteobacteria bacterium]|nr:hypothetical protein [Pseudomonadota bacterium]